MLNITVASVVGALMGIICTLIMKYCRFLNLTPTFEIIFIYCSAYGAYTIVEAFHYSGVVSLLIVGIVLGHYGW